MYTNAATKTPTHSPWLILHHPSVDFVLRCERIFLQLSVLFDSSLGLPLKQQHFEIQANTAFTFIELLLFWLGSVSVIIMNMFKMVIQLTANTSKSLYK